MATLGAGSPTGEMLSLAADVGAVLAQFILSFYAFWLVWRVLLPYLPGPREADARVAPFVGYFTDPFINPVARRLHLPTRLVALLALVVVASMSVLLRRVTSP